MVKVDIVTVKRVLKFIDSINELDLRQIEWMSGEYPLALPAQSIQDWEQLPRDNISFAREVLLKKV